jgi:nicotinamide mononucleotide transporter
MDFNEIISLFFKDLHATTWYEYLAVFSGLLSVWYSKKENILVYPVGLINTVTYVLISLKAHLPGEAVVNLYYTLMSLNGWYLWMKKDVSSRRLLHISRSTAREWVFQWIFFGVLFIVLFFVISAFRSAFFEGAIPWADALAAASAFTGMWLMTRKKLESWYWWILTNVISVPLYFVKHFVFTGLYYFILLFLAFAGLSAWKKKLITISDVR